MSRIAGVLQLCGPLNGQFAQLLQTTVTLCWCLCIGVGAQSILGGQDIIARKNMYGKLTRCPKFHVILARKIIKIPDFL